MSMLDNLLVNEPDDLNNSYCIEDVLETLSPGNPHSDMPSITSESPTSKSNLNLPNCFGVTSIPF